MITSKIIIEIRFSKWVSKGVIEQAVEKYASNKTTFIKPFLKHDPTTQCRIWYENLQKCPQVKVKDMLPKPNNPFKQIFNRNKGANNP